MEEQIAKLQSLIENASRIVFFGGAGVSTESGIPDFRSANGIFRQEREIPPETIVSRPFFDRYPEEFFAFYKEKLIYPNAVPNAAHTFLALLERMGKLSAVVTQNIDGLHQKAGSRTVFELHGSVERNRCMKCKKFFDASYVLACDGVPKCDCGGIVKPEVVLYGEPLEDETVENAVEAIRNSDLLIIAGTSLRVYPAAGLLRFYRGKDLVIINLDQTERDDLATLQICAPVGEVFGKLQAKFAQNP